MAGAIYGLAELRRPRKSVSDTCYFLGIREAHDKTVPGDAQYSFSKKFAVHGMGEA